MRTIRRRVGAQGILQAFRLQRTVGGAGHTGQFQALFFKLAQRAHDRVVLHAAGDDVVARLQETVQGLVEGIGDVVPEDHPQRVGGVEKDGNSLAGFIDDAGGLHGGAMGGASRVGADLVQKGCNCRGNSGRLGPGGGGVIQIEGSIAGAGGGEGCVCWLHGVDSTLIHIIFAIRPL